tara:strand:+ start:53 stop:670 length:618 start_codon:yes stop_codon:yes gene_type:complete
MEISQSPIDSKDTFIGVFDNVLERHVCESIITEFDDAIKVTSFAPTGELKDPSEAPGEQASDFLRTDVRLYAEHFSSRITNTINGSMKESLRLYVERYNSLKLLKQDFASTSVKLQKTEPRGGFHEWHCEVTSRNNASRCLVWMIYLNDLPEGEGETEFLWQGVKLTPKAGTLVLWPPYWTHPHRGNPPYTKTKYIATGWFNLVR